MKIVILALLQAPNDRAALSGQMMKLGIDGRVEQLSHRIRLPWGSITEPYPLPG